MNLKQNIISISLDKNDPFKTEKEVQLKRLLDVNLYHWQKEVINSKDKVITLIGDEKCGKSSLLYFIAARELLTRSYINVAYIASNLDILKVNKNRLDNIANGLTNGSKIDYLLCDKLTQNLLTSKKYDYFLIDEEANMNLDRTKLCYDTARSQNTNLMSVSSYKNFHENKNFSDHWWNLKSAKFSINNG